MASCARPSASDGRLVIDGDPLGLNPHVVGLDLQFGQRLGDAVRGRTGVGEGVAQCGRGVDRRKDLAARGFDIRFETFDLPIRRFVGF